MELHNELLSAGEARTRESAERLTGEDVRARLDTRVRRGRRRRDAGIGTVTAVAVGAIALGAANLPRWVGDSVAPAATASGIEPTPGGPYEFAEPAFDLAAEHTFECGAYLETAVPVVIHDEAVLDRQLMARATLEAADVVDAAGDAPTWFVDTLEGPGDEQLMWRTSVAAVRGGVVVGAAPGAGWSGDGHPLVRVAGEDEAEAPLPGQCDSPAAQLDGGYTQVVVVQVASFHKSTPLATFTFAEEVTYDGLEDYWRDRGVTFAEAPDGPAELREPAGDVYQAFVVPRPEPGSCTPLSDQRAMGQPGLHTIQYEVTIPGVQPLTNDLWAAAAVVDPGVPQQGVGQGGWYVGRDAWLVADDSGSMGEAGLEWSSDLLPGESSAEHSGDLRLVTGGGLGSSLAGEDCFFLARLDAVKGAVFLVIDGIDWGTVERENPGASWADTDALTWVYLGQAK